jgi:cell division inhibitor SulA
MSKGKLPPLDAESRYQLVLQPPDKIVISYVSRQHTNLRKLLQEDHSGLVAALTRLEAQKNEERQAIMDAIR